MVETIGVFYEEHGSWMDEYPFPDDFRSPEANGPDINYNSARDLRIRNERRKRSIKEALRHQKRESEKKR